MSLLWPFGLLVGYISIDLKRQLQRRGYHGGERAEAFSDLITLPRPAADAEKPGPGDGDRRDSSRQ